MEENKNKSSRPVQQLDLFKDTISEKIINSTMGGDEVVATVYNAPDPKSYD